ncbi:stromal membrane-associated protein 1 isoform X1 [Gadus macrocephalus]|uniref:stromal membrane-associated protein 1 isoform X1 n=1 Tax=Gadus macrocephalus TaxID=80720 RepID=UPI0028CB493B|nr:stromal membrane-associated protein 1 isoform X1 [Gadus macrocephalus]
MTTRSEREKALKLNEQHQVILSKMLREEENKYCCDCEAKGPRWASWNLGVFMCIRCAGIHRNLGVHIARVKSVNLDQWTPEQIQSMVDIGNRRARLMYEAHLPESFRRPQTDQAMEVFIRDKYERKKYYDKDAVTAPPKSSEVSPPTTVSQSTDKNRQEREQKRREEKRRDKDCDRAERPNGSKKRVELQSESRASPKKRAEPSVDLLGLDAPENSAGSGTGGGVSATGGSVPISDDLDIFGPMVSNPLPSSGNAHSNQAGSVQADAANSSSTTTATTTAKAEEKKTLSKDSILSLYATSSMAGATQSQHQPAAGQGMFMGQPQMQYAAQGYNGGMGGGAGMMPGMAVPNGGYMAMGQGMLPPGVAQGQGMYAMPQQQAQWNMNQMTQQMSAMAAGGGAGAGGAAMGAPGAFGQPAPMTGWSAPPPSGQTLSTQLWK